MNIFLAVYMISPYEKQVITPFTELNKAVDFCNSEDGKTIEKMMGNEGWLIEEHICNQYNQEIKIYDKNGNLKDTKSKDMSDFFLNSTNTSKIKP